MFRINRFKATAAAALFFAGLAASSVTAADLRAGTSMAANHPSAQALTKLSELVKERSNGNLNITA